MPKFNHFPSIEGFHHIRKFVEKVPDALSPGEGICYMPKIKLHGTNAGIQVTPDGTVLAQSRTRIIDVSEDNMGFAKWVDATKDFWTDKV